MKLLHVALLLILSVLTSLIIMSCSPSGERPPSSKTTKAPTAPVATSSEKSVSQPSNDEILGAVKKLVSENSQNIKINSIKDIKAARDNNGQWWVSAIAIPEKSANTDEAIIFIVKNDKTWELIDLGTGVSPHDLPLPQEVRSKLMQ